MILLLMQSRSGSSLVASIFAAHGYDTKNTDEENQFGYKDFEHLPAKKWLYSRKKKIGYTGGEFCQPMQGIESVITPNDCVKIGVEYWPCFQHLDAKVFCIRRDPEQIAKSLSEKRDNRSRKLQPDDKMREMVHRRVEMLNQARDESGGADIFVEHIVAGDFGQLRAAFDYHGLEFNEEKARGCVDRGKFKTR